ncbi:aminoacyl tRNA synthase complex-interacting multifunctional protein 1-like [Macrosteles quadrilineatus]|uniref:aminoacyl tRNA synthase complex-interacting multifunctional protein 1-like n=1 Tax=Macrosteles quadrilineatus TaxID=74068 RepID=UPI0023E0C2F7|nr:aminoacyl tRNA synthase complex-interacting multifunctional protein 1-like [Macrosteles quadrilineatus]
MVVYIYDPKERGETGRVKDISRVDLRVGKILDIQEHLSFPAKGYMCQVDTGDVITSQYNRIPWHRLIAVLLDPQYTMRELWKKMVVVLCNVIPGFSRGIYINGVLLCAEQGGKIELLSPSTTTKPGDKIYVEGYGRGTEKIFCPGDWRNETRDFTDMNFVRMFEDNIVPSLKVDSERKVLYRDIPLRIEGKDGFITAESLSDCPVTHVPYEEPLYPGQR